MSEFLIDEFGAVTILPSSSQSFLVTAVFPRFFSEILNTCILNLCLLFFPLF